MLGIRDILVRIRIPGSVPLDPDPTSDPTPLFSDFKDAKKFFFSSYFSYNIPTSTLACVLKIKFFAKVWCKFYFASIISVCSTHLWEEGRIRSRFRTVLLTNRSPSGRSNTSGSYVSESGSGSESSTLLPISWPVEAVVLDHLPKEGDDALGAVGVHVRQVDLVTEHHQPYAQLQPRHKVDQTFLTL